MISKLNVLGLIIFFSGVVGAFFTFNSLMPINPISVFDLKVYGFVSFLFGGWVSIGLMILTLFSTGVSK